MRVTSARRRALPDGVLVGGLLTGLLAGSVVTAPPASAAAPTVARATAAARPGHGVTLSGERLSGTVEVVFLGQEGAQDDLPATSFLAPDDRTVLAQVPEGAVSGPVEVRAADGTATSPAVAVLSPPVVESLSVSEGRAGDLVSLRGTGLTGATVTLGGRATVLSRPAAGTDPSTVLQLKVPAGVPGGVAALVVTGAGGTATAPFTIAPDLRTVGPANGPADGGSVALLAGTGLTGTSRVTVGGHDVTQLLPMSDGEVAVRLPAGTSGAADVALTTTSGTTTSSTTRLRAYEYRPIPAVTAVRPDWNALSSATTVRSSPVTVSGTGLGAGTAVTVGRTAVAPEQVQVFDGSLTFVPPPALVAGSAPITLTNTSPTGVAHRVTVPFTYAGPPTATRVAPASGPVGTRVTVTGSGFVSGTSVSFGAAPASCTVATPTSLSCLAPAGSGAVDVVVTTPLGSSRPAAPARPPVFTVLPGTAPATTPPAAPRPTVAGLSPTAGVAGSTLQLLGRDLQAVTGVDFAGAGSAWVPAERPLPVAAGRLLVRVPTGALTGALRLRRAVGDPVVTDMRYVAGRTPSISSVDAVGEASVGVRSNDLVVVCGKGLLVGSSRTTVTVDGRPGTILAQPAPTADTLVVKLPVGSGTRAPVVVATALGTATATEQLYHLPVVRSVRSAPALSATRSGGTPVTVTGSGFTGAHAVAGRLDAVTFDGVPAQQVVVLSDTSLVAVTAPGSAATDPVVVTTQQAGRTGASTGLVRDLDQPVPTLTALRPSTVVMGDQPVPVTVTGTHLERAAFTFGRDPGTVLSVSADGTEAVVVPPAREAPGVVTVTASVPAQDGPLTGSLPAAFRYQLPVPSLTAISASSVTAGRAPGPLTLTGAFLRDDVEVRFGTELAEVRSASPDGTTLVVVPPRRDSGGSLPVTVTNPTFDPPLTGTLTAPFGYALPVPTLTGISARSTLAGQVPDAVTLTGSSLTADLQVRFGTEPGQVVAAAEDGPSLVVVPPRRDTSGDVPVTATDLAFDPPLTGRLGVPFGYAYPVPVVAGISTPTALAGRTPEPVTLRGEHLSAEVEVRFGSALGTVVEAAADGTSLLVVPPRRDTAGDVPVTVTDPGFTPVLTGRLAAPFRYLFPTPTAATASAVSGLAGSTPPAVTLTGTHLGPDVVVRFGTEEATVTQRAEDGTRLVVLPPRRDTAGTVPVTLVDPSFDPPLTTTVAPGYTYVYPTPTVTALSATSTSASGTPAPVVLTGTHLTAGSVVRFGAEPATVVQASADGTRLEVLPPRSDTAARVLVTVTDVAFDPPLQATAPVTYRYLPRPTLVGLTPATSAVGTAPAEVTLTGSNLRRDTLVDFGGAPATVRSAADDGTSLVVLPPARSTAATVAVTITNVDGETYSATLPGAYEYRLAPAQVTGLQVGTTAATTAPAGTAVTVTGTSFLDVTAVRFGTVAASFAVLSPTSLVATVPLAPSGQQGQAVAVSVVNSTRSTGAAEPAIADDWVWDSAPAIAQLSASTGLQGSTVTLTGTGFTGTTAVRWGGVDAASFTVVSDTGLTARVPVTPAGGTGTADVTLEARGLRSAAPASVVADDWTWTPLAAISSVTTPVAEGGTVTVTGRGFTNVRTVTVNGTAVTPTVQSSTRLTFQAPNRPSGLAENYTNKPVVVVNGGGGPSTNDSSSAHLFSWTVL